MNLQYCLQAICKASLDDWKQCESHDIERAKAILEGIASYDASGPASQAAAPPGRLTTSQTAAPSGRLTTSHIAAPPGRLTTSQAAAPPRRLAPSQVAAPPGRLLLSTPPKTPPQTNAARRRSAPRTVVAEQLFEEILKNERKVKELIALSAVVALGLDKSRASLDYARLRGSSIQDKLRGHHSIIWTHNQYKESQKTETTSMDAYIREQQLPSQILRDGRKLDLIDVAYKQLKEKEISSMNPNEERANLLGELIPWLCFCYQTWRRLPETQIQGFVDLCKGSKTIQDFATDCLKCFVASKDLYATSGPAEDVEMTQSLRRKISGTLQATKRRRLLINATSNQKNFSVPGSAIPERQLNDHSTVLLQARADAVSQVQTDSNDFDSGTHPWVDEVQHGSDTATHGDSPLPLEIQTDANVFDSGTYPWVDEVQYGSNTATHGDSPLPLEIQTDANVFDSGTCPWVDEVQYGSDMATHGDNPSPLEIQTDSNVFDSGTYPWVDEVQHGSDTATHGDSPLPLEIQTDANVFDSGTYPWIDEVQYGSDMATHGDNPSPLEIQTDSNVFDSGTYPWIDEMQYGSDPATHGDNPPAMKATIERITEGLRIEQPTWPQRLPALSAVLA